MLAPIVARDRPSDGLGRASNSFKAKRGSALDRLDGTPSFCESMKRTFFIPFIAALIGGGVVVAVIAAFGDLGNSQKTVTTVQAAPLAPSNASQQSPGLTPHDIYVRDA